MGTTELRSADDSPSAQISDPGAGFDFTSTAGAMELDADLAAALDLLDEGLDRLIAAGDRGDLLALGPDRLVAFMRSFERHRSRLPVVDHAIVEAVEVERLWEHSLARSAAGAIEQTLKISYAEAKGRVVAAGLFGPQAALTGEALEPRLAVASLAQRAGELNCAQTRVIGDAVGALATNTSLDLDTLRDAESHLVAYARTFGPDELRKLGMALDNVLLPDGRLPREQVASARRGLTIGSQRPDGTSPVTGSLTPEAAALVFAVLSPLSAPRPSDEAGPDRRTAAQRTHDALEAACRRLLDAGCLPASGGTPATVHVTIPFRGVLEAMERSGQPLLTRAMTTGTAGNDLRVDLNAVLRLAREAEIVPVYLSDTGGVLGYGRDRRVFSTAQTNALIARDGGCTFPSCTAPPEWCERHHVIPWWLGGETDISNAALVCAYHHDRVDNHGWSMRMIDGLPHWIPPERINPDQTPLLNPRVASCPRLS